MIIAFDAKRAAQNRTGLGNYSREIMNIVKSNRPECDCLLFVPNRGNARQLDLLPGLERFEIVAPPRCLGGLFGSLWRSVGIALACKRRKVSLYHGLSNELPLGIRGVGCRSVVTIHDLIFMHCPQYYKPLDRWIYRMKMRYAAKVSDRIVTVSQYSKGEIERLLGVDEKKIDVVPPGCYLDFGSVDKTDVERVCSVYGLPKRFILYVGTIEERKNLMLVARALSKLSDGGQLPVDMRVVAVGKSTPYADKLQSYSKSRGLDIRFVHNVSFSDLPAVYKAADMLVYPSRIEGFGSPMLEAAAAGVPAIGCTGSSLEEAGGPGAIYVDPDDIEAMAESMLLLWNNAEERKVRGEKGLAHAASFDEKHLFRLLNNVYECALTSKSLR